MRSVIILAFAAGIAANIAAVNSTWLLFGTGVMFAVVSGYFAAKKIAVAALPEGTGRVVCVLLAAYVGALWSQGYAWYFGGSPLLSSSVNGVWVEAEVDEIRARYGKPGMQVSLKITQTNRSTVPPGLVVRAFWGGSPDLWYEAQRVRLRLDLDPLPYPTVPGGYNWARSLFFDGHGAIGIVTSRPVVEQVHGGIQRALTFIRAHLIDRVNSYVSASARPVALALMVGRRSEIPGTQIEAYRAAGLAHLLAISGLHIGWVSFLFYFGVRRMLALFPSIVLRYPAHKWAAIVAMVATMIYAGIAESSVATQRATLMAMTAYLALLCNRKVLSMHTIHVALIAALLANPESLLSAGFQLSFVATWTLVAVFSNRSVIDMLARVGSRIRGPIEIPEFQARLLSRSNMRYGTRAGLAYAAKGAFTLLIVNVVSGLSTAPIVAFHFGEVPLYGLIGNLFAVPAALLVVMPSLVALAILPFLSAAALAGTLVSAGIDAISLWARELSSLPGAVVPATLSKQAMVSICIAVAILGVAGSRGMAIWHLLLAKTARNRSLLSVLVLLVGMGLWGVIIARQGNDLSGVEAERWVAAVPHRGSAILFLDSEGNWQALGKPYARLLKRWIDRHDLITIGRISYAQASSDNGVGNAKCDRLGCSVQMVGGGSIGIDFGMGGLIDSCRHNNWVVVTYTSLESLPDSCRSGQIIDRGTRNTRGTMALVTEYPGKYYWHGAADQVQRWR